jgi:hypothetical protein
VRLTGDRKGVTSDSHKPVKLKVRALAWEILLTFSRGCLEQ